MQTDIWLQQPKQDKTLCRQGMEGSKAMGTLRWGTDLERPSGLLQGRKPAAPAFQRHMWIPGLGKGASFYLPCKLSSAFESAMRDSAGSCARLSSTYGLCTYRTRLCTRPPQLGFPKRPRPFQLDSGAKAFKLEPPECGYPADDLESSTAVPTTAGG